MVADRRLDNVLRALLQPGYADPLSANGSRVYASAATVLTTLTNPLNVSLLATQILVSPAIWQGPDQLSASLRTFDVFQAATHGKIETAGSVLGVEEWINAVVRGANQNVPRWKHLLLLGGILSADHERSHLVAMTRRSLEDAFCKAVNLSLETNLENVIEADVLSLILSHVIQSLSYRARELLNYDALLTAVTKSIYYSPEGFQSGYFLPAVDNDIVEIEGRISWPSKSNSFLELQQRSGRPLFVSMSRLARLAATAISKAGDIRVIHAFLSSLARFSQIMNAQWRTTRLSSVASSQDKTHIDAESLKATMPVIWQILKSALFTTTMILHELESRVIESPIFCDDYNGPYISSQTLHILRNFFFVTCRLGPNAFASYNFVYLASIDILSSYTAHSEKITLEMAPKAIGTIPPALLDQQLDLYFLNTMEHLLPALPSLLNEDVVVPSASPYLSPDLPSILKPHFEAAHSMMFALLASGPSAEVSAKFLPFYVDTLFSAFPITLSARQFCLAVKTLVRECSPPQPISRYQPQLLGVVLEIVSDRCGQASTVALPKNVDEGAVGLSEKDVYILALIEALPFMESEVMGMWLDPIADILNTVENPGSRRRIQERFWDTLSGELDVARAETAVLWWSSRGREKVFGGLGHQGTNGINGEVAAQTRPRL